MSRCTLVCNTCGGVTYIPDEEVEPVREAVVEAFDFQLMEHHIEMYGRCAVCRLRLGGPWPRGRA
jgi:Fe2+ or Zn2+ uptake regulation protein